MTETATEIWRKYEIEGVPASGFNQPNKDDIRLWGTSLETALLSGVAGRVYATLSNLNADLTPTANSSAMVYNDSTGANNGIYMKVGGTGTGSWTRISDLPYAIVPLTVSGGTANAIQTTATETPTLPGRKLFLLTPTANNTGATTLNNNGSSTLPVVSAFGTALVGGELLSGSPALLLGGTANYTLLLSTNVDASGILASAQAAQTASAVSAAAAANSSLIFPAPSMMLAAMPKTATATLTISSPGVVNWTGHGLPGGTPVFITTTGALPTGLTAGTTYYTTFGASLQTNSFRLSSSIANAIAGTSINFTGSQSGTHTTFANFSIPYPYKGYRITRSIQIADNIGLFNNTDLVWNSITLPAGNWRCLCQSGVIHNTGTTPVITHMHSDFGIGTTNIQTSPAGGATTALHVTSADPNGWIFPNGERIFNLPSGGVLNAVMQCTFSGSTGDLLAYGTLNAELF